MKKNLLATALASVLIAGTCCLPLTSFAAEKAKQKPKPYPLETCAVTDEKLGEMGDPYVFTYKDREIKLCCKGCLKKFNKEPEKFVKKVDEQAKRAKKSS